ncbi:MULTISPECIES: heme-degrading domain-containing protein [unclassified Sphingomonas]|uniref:heme-degrading domain-containing protein n=1 Tax=Novosphingobium rhizosphaerae TaxID=1551649 RepID=UPI0015C733AC
MDEPHHDSDLAIARIEAEVAALELAHFDLDDAWWLGCYLRERAARENLPIAIEIRRGVATLFACLLPGASADNSEWLRRKLALVMRFERCTYVLGLTFRREPGLFERHGLDLRDHIADGGGVPIRLAGTGTIGALGISGLPQEDDHRLAIEALGALRAHQASSERTMA